MLKSLSFRKTPATVPLVLLQNKSALTSWLKSQPKLVQNWVKSNHFRAAPGEACLLPDRDGGLRAVAVGVSSFEDPFQLSKDGNFSWEEVECLGACVNAPMVLIWKDTYEDLTKESFGKVLDGFASGNPPKPGLQIDRQLSAPVGGPTTLKEVT